MHSASQQQRSEDSAGDGKGTPAAEGRDHLVFDGVWRRFQGSDAVVDVSFALAKGEIACLLGPSGCGKTTLLRLAAGIDRPSAGRILLNGKEVAGPNRFEPPERRNIGLMFQDFALFPHLTILENVMFGLRSLSRKEARRQAHAALARVRLDDFAELYPHKLSGGEQQRVALARAVVPQPQVMLMDEPFSGLDDRLRDSVRADAVALLRETGSSCLLVTHDPVEAMGIADRILLMRQGRLVQTGTPQQLYRQPIDIAAARFFSECSEIHGLSRSGGVDTPIGSFRSPEGLSDGPVSVLLRPQALQIADGPVGLEGYILESRFEGAEANLSVLFKGIEKPLSARVPARHLPRSGETAVFAVDSDHVLVFARATSDPT